MLLALLLQLPLHQRWLRLHLLPMLLGALQPLERRLRAAHLLPQLGLVRSQPRLLGQIEPQSVAQLGHARGLGAERHRTEARRARLGLGGLLRALCSLALLELGDKARTRGAVAAATRGVDDAAAATAAAPLRANASVLAVAAVNQVVKVVMRGMVALGATWATQQW
eukprot:351958-Chlamydomonas_euryale.AAC.1